MSEQVGESDRAYLGIDGTAGDAQDVDHPFVPSLDGSCSVCGMAKSFKRHGGDVMPTSSHNAGSEES